MGLVHDSAAFDNKDGKKIKEITSNLFDAMLTTICTEQKHAVSCQLLFWHRVLFPSHSPSLSSVG